MNRVSAASLDPKYSGEKVALEWVLNKIHNQEEDSKELVLFDCGANYGSYTKMVLDLIKKQNTLTRIYLFEPSLICFDALQKEFGYSINIQLFKLGVSNKNDLAELYYSWEGSCGASLSREVMIAQGSSQQKEKIQSEQVNLIKLDDFCQENKIEKIDFLKLDIEGYELSALEGISDMLSRKKVSFIQVEIGSASLATKCMLFDIWTMLNSSYNFYLILKHGVTQIVYKPDLECFFGASNFLLELKRSPA